MGSGGCACVAVSVTIGVIAIVIVALVASSLKRIESTEIGLKYDYFSKHLADKPTFEGLHAGNPGYTFLIFPSIFKTLSFSYTNCLNKDGVEIKLSISYQYKVEANKLKNVFMQFKDIDSYTTCLRAFGYSSIHDTCSQFNTTEFQSRRGEFQEQLRNVIVGKYADVHAQITDLQVNDITRPSGYEDAVKSKENAREDIEVAESENPKLVTAAKTVELQAETEANITMDAARTQVSIKTSEALAQAKAILNEYEKEAESYKFLMSPDGLNMDVDSFLAYLGIRAIEDAVNDVQVGVDSPAKTSYLESNA